MKSEHPPHNNDQAQHALGTVVQLAAGLDSRRLDAAAGRGAAVSMSRLQADAVLLKRLAAEGFEGPGWDRFVRVLVEYGCAVLTAWTVTGAINGYVARHALIRLERPPAAITQEDAEDLAVETVADALGRFRDRVLAVGRWDPRRGTSLATFWIGYCILRFPDVYRRWLTAQSRWHRALQNADGDRTYRFRPTLGDPVEQVVLDEEVVEALACIAVETTRQILQLKAAGYSHEEIADLVGCSVKSIESRLDRHWRNTRAG